MATTVIEAQHRACPTPVQLLSKVPAENPSTQPRVACEPRCEDIPQRIEYYSSQFRNCNGLYDQSGLAYNQVKGMMGPKHVGLMAGCSVGGKRPLWHSIYSYFSRTCT